MFYCISHVSANKPISQSTFMLSIAINRAKHVCATVIIKHISNYTVGEQKRFLSSRKILSIVIMWYWLQCC